MAVFLNGVERFDWSSFGIGNECFKLHLFKINWANWIENEVKEITTGPLNTLTVNCKRFFHREHGQMCLRWSILTRSILDHMVDPPLSGHTLPGDCITVAGGVKLCWSTAFFLLCILNWGCSSNDFYDGVLHMFWADPATPIDAPRLWIHRHIGCTR